MYEEHAMSAIYMDAEMSHHGDPGSGDNTESYHPGLVIEQLNKVLFLCQSYNPRVVGMQMSRCKYVKAVIASSALAPTPGKLLHLLLPFQQSQMLGTNIMQIVTCIGLNQCTTCPLYIQLGWCYIWNDLTKLHSLSTDDWESSRMQLVLLADVDLLDCHV